MMKGGYKIVNFNGATLSGTAVEMPGIYNQIVDEYDKPIMVSGVTLSGELQDDAYASVKVNEGSVNLTVYGGVITVTEDDEVTFTSAKSNTELSEDVNVLNNLYNSKNIRNTIDSLISLINSMSNGQTAIATVSGEVNTYLYNINSSSLTIIRKGNNFATILTSLANGTIGTSNYSGNAWSSVIFTGTSYTPA